MAPTLRGTPTAGSRTAASTTCTVTLPTGVAAGDGCVVFVKDTQTPTFPAGWAAFQASSIFAKRLTSADVAAGSFNYTVPSGTGSGGWTCTAVQVGTWGAYGYSSSVRSGSAGSGQNSTAIEGVPDALIVDGAVLLSSGKTLTGTYGSLRVQFTSGPTASCAVWTQAPGAIDAFWQTWTWSPTGTFSFSLFEFAFWPPNTPVSSLGVNSTAFPSVASTSSLGVRSATALIPVSFPAPDAPALPGSFTPAVPLHAPVRRRSQTFPAPTLDSRGIPTGWASSSEVEEDWGWRRIVIDGVDRTYTGSDNGMPTVTVDYELAEPFGCGPGTLTALLVSPYQGPPSWLAAGKAVDVVRLHPDGTTTSILWSGEIAASGAQIDERSRRLTCDLVGDLWAADTQTHKPPLYRPETDCGTVIADTLNAVVNRRVKSIPRATTGITTSARGASTDTPISFVQQLLATMTTDDGSSQWTVGRTGTARSYHIALKNRTTVNWTVRFGQPGAQISLTRDPRTAPNRIYASGVSPEGYAWANWVYPLNRPDAAPSYPFGSPSTVMTIGTTDASTTSGTGVSDWQTRVNTLGIPGAKVTVDGSYSSQDAAACRIVQKAYGITVDGVVGPQTWAATWDVGANGANLDGAFRMPLAWNPATMPRLLHADGSDAGANSAWDSTLLVVDRDEDMGAGITKAQAVRSAQAEISRNPSPGLIGEIILTGDPREGSRLDIREGHNIKVLGFQGSDVLLHIAQVRVSGLTVRLAVDERASDLVTLAGVLSRDQTAATDPARMPARKVRRSVLARDAIVDFDSESPGGQVPDFALFGGLWSVIHIPVSQQGSVAEITLTTHGPASPFVVAFFGDSVTAAFMVSHVGANPLSPRSDGYGPFDWDRDNLLTAGFIEAIGGPGQAAGYDHGFQTSPYTGTSTALTGKLRSTAGFQYRSVRPPWLWLAFYSPTSTRIYGRLVPAPVAI